MHKFVIAFILIISLSIAVIGGFVLFSDGNNGYVGLTEEEAISKGRYERTPVRVLQRDGQRYSLTDDYISNRANLVIENGRVTAVEFY